MSFRRDYLPFFSIRTIEHGSADVISGSEVVPTSECRKKIRNHQLLTRQRDYGLQVYYSTNPWAASPLLGEISSRTRFDFVLRLPGDFYQRFHPDIAGNEKLHLHNLQASGDLKPGNAVTLSASPSTTANDAIKLVSQRFELEVTTPAGATAFELRSQFGATVLSSFDLDELGQGARLEFDLDGRNSGRYRLSPDSHPSQIADIFVEDEVAGQSCQGLVSIYLETAQTLAPAAGYEFNARFEAR